MLFGQRCTITGRVRCALWPPSCRQTLHEFERQLHAEVEVLLVGMLNLPESERVENADVDEPPHQACPALATLPTWQIGVVKLIDHIDGEGGVEQ